MRQFFGIDGQIDAPGELRWHRICEHRELVVGLGESQFYAVEGGVSFERTMEREAAVPRFIAQMEFEV